MHGGAGHDSHVTQCLVDCARSAREHRVREFRIAIRLYRSQLYSVRKALLSTEYTHNTTVVTQEHKDVGILNAKERDHAGLLLGLAM